jgi:uncharacterized cupin superfamily protein
MNITQFKNTLTAPLGAATTVAVPLGEPLAMTASSSVERSDGVEAGIWECSPGRHFIAGRCTFTPDGGEPLQIEAGDALMLPANCTGIWDVTETVRKTFVLML